MSLTRSIATTHNHIQTDPSALWTINHNLIGYPIVDVFIDVDGVLNKIIPTGVSYVDANTCTVSFSSAQTGYAVVV